MRSSLSLRPALVRDEGVDEGGVAGFEMHSSLLALKVAVGQLCAIAGSYAKVSYKGRGRRERGGRGYCERGAIRAPSFLTLTVIPA